MFHHLDCHYILIEFNWLFILDNAVVGRLQIGSKEDENLVMLRSEEVHVVNGTLSSWKENVIEHTNSDWPQEFRSYDLPVPFIGNPIQSAFGLVETWCLSLDSYGTIEK